MKKYKFSLTRSSIVYENDVEDLFEHLIKDGKYSLDFILQLLETGDYHKEEYEDIYNLLEEDCYTNADEVNLKVEKL